MKTVKAKVNGRDEYKNFLVDDEDYEIATAHKWQINYKGYVKRTTCVEGHWSTLSFHRVIMGLVQGDGLEIDHKDRNTLNNQKSNLRICNQSPEFKNAHNRGPKKNSRSKYRNVCFHRGRWEVRMICNGVSYYFGSYLDEDEAGKVASRERLKLMAYATE